MSDTSQSILMIGAGGHARVCLDTLLACELDLPCGVITPDLNAGANWLYDIPVIGDDEEGLAQLRQSKPLAFVNGLGFMPGSTVRASLTGRYQEAGASFISLRHPSALIAKQVTLSTGTQIMANSTIQFGASIGSHSIVNTGVIVEHDGKIGVGCHLAPGSIICGDAELEDNVFVGAGAIIIQGVKIGAGSVIGAGQTIKRNLLAGTWIKD